MIEVINLNHLLPNDFHVKNKLLFGENYLVDHQSFCIFLFGPPIFQKLHFHHQGYKNYPSLCHMPLDTKGTNGWHSTSSIFITTENLCINVVFIVLYIILCLKYYIDFDTFFLFI